MNRTILLVAALAVAAPLALAHTPAGTPKPYCEDPSEWWLHDYGPASGGQFSFTFADGNADDCDGDTVAADPDNHFEYAAGGAWFPVWSETFDQEGNPTGGGTIPCFGVEGHHPPYGTFGIADAAAQVSQPIGTFTVAADTIDVTGLNPQCGDGFMDVFQSCSGICTVGFPPGLDGSYYVFVQGTVGHAWLV